MSSIAYNKIMQSELVFENDNPRFQRALKILELDDPINEVENGIYTVKAQGGYGLYKVEDTGEWKCNCPDYITRGEACKHILATRYYLVSQRETITGTETEKIPISPSQAWSAYNQAQVMDKVVVGLISCVNGQG